MEKYERFKKWLEQNRPKIVIAACFILVFLLGFGTGSYNKENFSKRSAYTQTQNNYTTKPAAKQTEVVVETIPMGQGTSTKVLGNSADKKDCIVKGNISSKGAKIYHVKGGSFYDRTNPEQCFNTEAEAKAAGYVKSSR